MHRAPPRTLLQVWPVTAQERVSRPRPEHVHPLEARLLHPAQLLGQRRGLVHRVGVVVDDPALAHEELVGSPVAVDLFRAAYLLLRRGEVAPGVFGAGLRHVGEQQRAAGLQPTEKSREQISLARTVEVVEYQGA